AEIRPDNAWTRIVRRVSAEETPPAFRILRVAPLSDFAVPAAEPRTRAIREPIERRSVRLMSPDDRFAGRFRRPGRNGVAAQRGSQQMCIDAAALPVAAHDAGDVTEHLEDTDDKRG